MGMYHFFACYLAVLTWRASLTNTLYSVCYRWRASLRELKCTPELALLLLFGYIYIYIYASLIA